MSALPNMSILNVSDPFNAKYLPKLTLKSKGPKIFRIEKGKLNCLYNSEKEIKNGFGYFSSNSKNIIVSTGIMSQVASKIKKHYHDRNKNISFLDLIKVKPVNEKKLLNILVKYKTIFTLEENMPFGGISFLISNIIATNNLNIKLVKFSLPEKYLFDSGPRDWMHKKYGLDKKKIIKEIDKFI